jgi:DNA-binding transcriptional regulator YiaG
LRETVARLQEEIRIKDARMSRIPAAQRPRYACTERLDILSIRATTGWSAAQTARRFLVSAATIGSWTGRVDDGDGDARALVDTREPVNRFPQFVTLLVHQLKDIFRTRGAGSWPRSSRVRDCTSQRAPSSA